MQLVLDVKILDARFHPHSRRSEASLVLARVYCQHGTVALEPVQSALEHTTPMRILRSLVEHAGPNTYESLLTVSSEYWSFDICRPQFGSTSSNDQ